MMGQWMGVSKLSSDGVDDHVELEDAEDAAVLVAEVAEVLVVEDSESESGSTAVPSWSSMTLKSSVTFHNTLRPC